MELELLQSDLTESKRLLADQTVKLNDLQQKRDYLKSFNRVAKITRTRQWKKTNKTSRKCCRINRYERLLVGYDQFTNGSR